MLLLLLLESPFAFVIRKCKKFDASCLLSLFAFGFSFRQCTFLCVFDFLHLSLILLQLPRSSGCVRPSVYLSDCSLGLIWSWSGLKLHCVLQLIAASCNFVAAASFSFPSLLHFLVVFFLSSFFAGQLQSVSHIKICSLCKGKCKNHRCAFNKRKNLKCIGLSWSNCCCCESQSQGIEWQYHAEQ